MNARTFGMEGMFRQYGIYSSDRTTYTPVDADQVMYYKEDENRSNIRRRHYRSRCILFVDCGGNFVQQQ